MTAGTIRTGVGGWTFEPWRGVFYPDDLKQKDELNYASRHLTTIEINGTYYGSQKPETWRKWRAETPDGFVFSVKGSRFSTNRKVLSEGKESVGRFLGQGLEELGDRLGPILWQFANTKKFDRDDFAGFLDLLPDTLNGGRLRHVVEPRHDSFIDPAFVQLLRERNIGLVHALHDTYPGIWDLCGETVYVRLQTGSDEVETAYPEADLKAWAQRLVTWSRGGAPSDLDTVAEPAAKTPRDVFCFLIHEGKVRAPAGAQALMQQVRALQG